MRASCCRRWRSGRALKLVAVHVHVGSQITTLEPLRRAAAVAARCQRSSCARRASPLEYVDLGGGLGISYDGGDVPSAADYVGALVGEVRPTGAADRARAGPRDCRRRPACCVARVIDIKPRDASSDFVVIDAGMTELMRPALYGAFHRIEPVSAARRRRRALRDRRPGLRKQRRRRPRPACCRRSRSATSSPSATPARTDRRWRRTTIAGRCRPKCWWTTARWRVIRRRQTVDDMLALETEPVRRADRGPHRANSER